MSERSSFVSALAFVAGVAAALCGAGTAVADVEETAVTISAGRVSGLYYPVAGAICTLINQDRREHGITCTVEITRGSLENLDNLREGRVELALAQADQVRDAMRGTGGFDLAEPFETLRSVFAPYVEHFTVVARADANVGRFEELKGTRVYMGGLGSGRRDTMRALMEAHGWDIHDVIDINEFEALNEAEALCDNEFDAFIHIIGHPNQSVYDASVTCDVVLVPIVDESIQRLIAETPVFVSSRIPAEMYRRNPRPIPGFGIPAMLVTTTKVDPDIIYKFTRIFFENLALLQEASPIFSILNRREMVAVGLAAPLHEGAERYFEEVRLY